MYRDVMNKCETAIGEGLYSLTEIIAERKSRELPEPNGPEMDYYRSQLNGSAVDLGILDVDLSGVNIRTAYRASAVKLLLESMRVG